MADREDMVRRRALRRIIDTDERWKGNVSAFARTVRKQQSQIADMLDGRKSFGEKVARSLERAAGLSRGVLDTDPRHHTESTRERNLSEDAEIFARTFDGLDPELKLAVKTLVNALLSGR